MSRIRTALLVALVVSASPLLAQTGGGPQLEIEEVTVIGRRVVVLPTARKGEVVDTSIYELPPGDTLLFGERISNLEGPGGALPGYRELESPVAMSVEGSLGSYFSPRARAHGEFFRKDFDLAGTIDYRGTAGHIDSAEASSLLLGAAGSLVVGGDAIVPRQRVSLGFEYLGDGYFLYGNPATPYDRSRSMLQAGFSLQSEEDRATNYALDIDINSISVDDRMADTSATGTGSASVLTPRFGFQIGGAINGIDLILRTSYMAPTLDYDRPAGTPSLFSASLDGRYRLSPKLSLGGGIFYQAAGKSDTAGGSGLATMLMPRISLRYDLDSALSLHAAFTPEIRAASYRDRIMQIPYVDREITLRPEKVPLNLTFGARYTTGTMTLEAGGYMEQSEDRAAVVVGSDSTLRYAHFESRSAGVRGSAKIEALESLALLLEARVGSAVDPGTDRTIPFHPLIDLHGSIRYALSEPIDIFSTITFRSARSVVTGDSLATARDLPSHLLLDIGGSYAIVQNLQIVASVTNLLGTAWEIFPGYSAQGLEVRAGARLEF